MISDYLTDKLDRLTTKLQRRGHKLTVMQVYAVGGVFALTVSGSFMRDSYFFAAVNGLVWGWNLWERIQWAEKHKDYQESIKHVEHLNMQALAWREGTRWFVSIVAWIAIAIVGLAIGLMIAQPAFLVLVTIMEWLAVVGAFLVRGCFFIGPGEFAKQKQERELHNAVLDKLP